MTKAFLGGLLAAFSAHSLAELPFIESTEPLLQTMTSTGQGERQRERLLLVGPIVAKAGMLLDIRYQFVVSTSNPEPVMIGYDVRVTN